MKFVIPLLLVLILLSGCSKNQNDLQSMADEKDSPGLIEFISTNKDDSTKSELVKFAINLLVSNDLKEGKDFIEKMIRQGKQEPIIEQALQSYIVSKKQFESIDQMLSHYFLMIKNNSTPSYIYAFRSVLTSGDKKVMTEKIRSLFIGAIEKDDYIQSKSAVDLLVKYLEFTDSLSTRISFLIQETIELTDNSNDSFSEYIDRVYISQLSDSIRNFYSKKRDDFTEEWSARNPDPGGSALEPVIKNDPNKVNNTVLGNDVSSTPSESFYLSGYIVSQNESNSYEIIVPGQTYRAILYTRYTTFTTKGNFSLPVEKSGTQKVSVKEEYGGFSQEWNTYSEVRPEDIQRWQAYKNREVLQAQYENRRASTLTPVLEGMERAEQQDIEKLANRKNEMAKVLFETLESYKKEIREIYKECFKN